MFYYLNFFLKNENGYRIISPTKAFELIQEQSNIKSTHDKAGEEFKL